MKHYRHGEDTKKMMQDLAGIQNIKPDPSNVLFADVIPARFYTWPSMKSQTRSQSTRVCSSGIYLKEELRIVVRIPWGGRGKMNWDQFDANVKVCNHQEIGAHRGFGRERTRSWLSMFVANKMQDNVDHEVKSISSTSAVSELRMYSPGLMQCHKCYTEIQLEVNHKDARTSEIRITSWKDMGTCDSIYDAKWETHFRGGWYLEFYEAPKVIFEPGSIKKAFEACEVTGSSLIVRAKRKIAGFE